ncbi:toxin-antitoxin system HicB family antitoxin [Actinoplanes sp. NPDC051411]|uniref:CopG family ribbon-helix-helix protein n=1 Tax=Actinoplanes sp. NPDC051411 TaxID=3155522 RepID=UPI0034399A0C
MANMTLRLPDELHDRVTRQAEAEDVSVQSLANKAIREYLERRSLDADIDVAMGKIKDRYGDVLERLGQ